MYSELKKVLSHIVTSVGDTQVVSLYTNLSELFAAASTTPSTETSQKIEGLLGQIEEVQSKIEPNNLDSFSRKIFFDFDKNNVLGLSGVKTLHSVLDAATYDLNIKSNESKRLGSLIGEEFEKAKKVIEGLAEVFGPEKTESETEGTQIQITFDGKVSIDNLDQLTDQAKFWNTQIKLADRVIQDNHGGVSITMIHKSSPTILDLIGPETKIVLLFWCFKKGLELLDQAVTIKKKMAEIQALGMGNSQTDKVVQAMEEGLKETIESGFDKATQAIISELGKEKSKILPPECSTPVNFLIRNNYEFAKKEGDVSLVQTKKQDEEEIQESVRIEKMREGVKGLNIEVRLLLPSGKLSAIEKSEETKIAEESEKKTKKHGVSPNKIGERMEPLRPGKKAGRSKKVDTPE